MMSVAAWPSALEGCKGTDLPTHPCHRARRRAWVEQLSIALAQSRYEAE